MTEFEKVGRMLPGDDRLFIIWNGKGVIGSVSPKRQKSAPRSGEC